MNTSMILIASEQIWPNLGSVVHWMEKEASKLARVFIYYTDDTHRSLYPAKSLQTIIKGLYKHLEVVMPNSPLGHFPQDLFSSISEWTKKYPNDNFVINATGGTKLLSFGLINFISSPSVKIIYRELSTGQWFSIYTKALCDF